MAWMEQRRRRFVVYTRMDGAKAKGPSYAARADAELFVTLAERFGWHAAQEFVTDDKPATAAGPAERTIREQAVAGGAIEDPAALPASDAGLLAPHGREPSGVSVGELTRRHFDAGTARAKTLEQYRSNVRDHVDPFFGDLDAAYVIRQSHPLAEGTSAKDVVTWRAWLAAQPVLTRHGRPTGRTLAAKTIKNVMSLVASAYDTAMHDEFSPLVGFNPVTGLAPTQTAADEIERVFLSPRQFGDLYWHTIDHYRHLLLFLVLTGLRWGEAAGLRVRDVTLHPEKGRPYLEVRTALKRVKSGTLLGLLKSRAARRRLTIPTLLVPTIEDAIAGKDLDDILQEGHGHGEGNEQRHCSGSNRIHIGWRLVISPAFGPKSRDEDEGSGTDQQYTQQDLDGDASSHLRMLLVRAGTSTGSRTTAKSCPSTDPATACATG